METGAEREAEVMQMLKDLFANRQADLKKHRVLLFGSRARGDAKPRSDFDLAVDGDEPLAISKFYEIEEALDALPTLYRFDWVDLAKVNARLREEAIKSARVIYVDDDWSHDQVFGHLKHDAFSAAEAAEYLEVSVPTLRRHVQSGRLKPSAVVGRNQMFSTADLRAFKRAGL